MRLIYANYYAFDPDFLDEFEAGWTSLDSDVIATDYAPVDEVNWCLNYLDELFPWYKSTIKWSKSKVYKIFWNDGQGINWKNATEENTSSLYTADLAANDYDLVLASWWSLLDEDFDTSILSRYRDFWFSRQLDFVCALSAMKSRKIFMSERKQSEWVNNGVRMTITSDMHGDMQLEQTVNSSWLALSPFHWFVPYKPAENKLLRSYFHTESKLMAILMSYISQLWNSEVHFWKGYEKLKEILMTNKVELWPYWNAWDIDDSRVYDAYLSYRMNIAWIHDKTRHFIGQNPSTTPNEKPYTFYIDDEWNLVIYIWLRGNQESHMVLDVVDAENIVVWICNNSLKWIWRTWNGELLKLLEYIEHWDIETDKFFEENL